MSAAGNPSLDTVELIAERVGVHPLALFPEPRPTSLSGPLEAGPARPANGVPSTT
jgi:hypothetical protein